MFLKEEYLNFLNELTDVYDGAIQPSELVEMANELQDIIFNTERSLEEVFGVVMRYENQNCRGYESFVFSLVISSLPDDEKQVRRAYDFVFCYHDFNLFLFVTFNKEYLTEAETVKLISMACGVYDNQLLKDYGIIE